MTTAASATWSNYHTESSLSDSGSNDSRQPVRGIGSSKSTEVAISPGNIFLIFDTYSSIRNVQQMKMDSQEVEAHVLRVAQFARLMRATVESQTSGEALGRQIAAALRAFDLSGGSTGVSWKKILDALADPQWEFRTVEGIARQTGLQSGEVAQLLKQHRSEVRIAPILDRKDRVLYTDKSRRRTWREILWEIQACVSKSL